MRLLTKTQSQAANRAILPPTAFPRGPAVYETTVGRPCDTLRVALFSGNYNCVRDGANQALNRLVAHLEKNNVAVRVYSPTVDTPAFAPAGTLVSVPSVALPSRREYRLASPLTHRLKRDLIAFRPDIIHISAPDALGISAHLFAKKMNIPTIASVHTRFETYCQYYFGLNWLEGVLKRYLRWLYSRCDQVLVPSPCMAEILRSEGIESDIRYWQRGVDHALFRPDRRDLEWRRGLGFADDDVVISFVGRIVLEKGLAAFSQAINRLEERGVKFRVLIVGDGPARPWFEKQLPNAIFTGALYGTDLARAFASADIFFNPSTTETFGNVNLEAMASGVPAICAQAPGNNSLTIDTVTGLLVPATDPDGYVRALERLVLDPELRKDMQKASTEECQNYKWDAILDTVHQHYLSAVTATRSATNDDRPAFRPASPDFSDQPGASG